MTEYSYDDRHVDLSSTVESYGPERPDTTGERSHATTTHAEWGAGAPRLLLHSDGLRGEYALTHVSTRIGSAPESEIYLADLPETLAIVRHNDRDEFVLTLHASGQTTANPDPDGTGHQHDIVLRTGAQFRSGSYTFVFQREEFADHGRPFGGRQGGEFAEQPPQPRRPDYSVGEPSGMARPLEKQDD